MLTNDELIEMQQKLEPKSLIIVKFTADQCGPCKNIKSITQEYINKFPETINIFLNYFILLISISTIDYKLYYSYHFCKTVKSTGI